MSSNPCLTFLLVYSAIVSIALIITSALLATSHSTLVCKGDGGEEVVVHHHSVVEESKDKVVEGQPEDSCKCHCNCQSEDLVTAGEIFILTCVGIL